MRRAQARTVPARFRQGVADSNPFVVNRLGKPRRNPRVPGREDPGRPSLCLRRTRDGCTQILSPDVKQLEGRIAGLGKEAAAVRAPQRHGESGGLTTPGVFRRSSPGRPVVPMDPPSFRGWRSRRRPEHFPLSSHGRSGDEGRRGEKKKSDRVPCRGFPKGARLSAPVTTAGRRPRERLTPLGSARTLSGGSGL